MRQLCNISYVAQAESKAFEEGAFEKWEAELNHPPAEYVRRRRRAEGEKPRPLTRIDPGLFNLMPQAGSR